MTRKKAEQDSDGEPRPVRRPIGRPALITILGWAVGWAICWPFDQAITQGVCGTTGPIICRVIGSPIGVSISWAVGSPIGLSISWAIGAAIGGLAMGLGLRRMIPAIQWKHIVIIALCWAISLPTGPITGQSISQALNSGLLIFAGTAIAGAMGGAITGLVLAWVEPTVRWQHVVNIAFAWAAGLNIGMFSGRVIGDIVGGGMSWIIREVIAGVTGGAIIGAIGGLFTCGQIEWSGDSRRARSEPSVLRWRGWAMMLLMPPAGLAAMLILRVLEEILPKAIAFAIGGAAFGLISGVALWWVERYIRWDDIVIIALGVAAGFGIIKVADNQHSGLELGGLIIMAVLYSQIRWARQRVAPSIPWGPLDVIFGAFAGGVVGFGIGWVFHIGWAVGMVVGGATGGLVTFWRFNRAQQRLAKARRLRAVRKRRIRSARKKRAESTETRESTGPIQPTPPG